MMQSSLDHFIADTLLNGIPLPNSERCGDDEDYDTSSMMAVVCRYPTNQSPQSYLCDTCRR